MKIEFTKEEKKDILETGISWVVVLMMSVYGIAKIQQFDSVLNPNTPLVELSGMELMWTFYDYSLPFALIIGAFEIIGAILIFFKRTRLIGCLLTSTILINIILQDFFYGVNVGALFNAISYQIIILIILWLNRNILKKTYKTITTLIKPSCKGKKRTITYGITFLVFIIILTTQHILTSLVGQYLN